MVLRKPYLIFLGDAADASDAKTAFGLRDWIREDVVGQMRLPHCRVDLGLPEMTPRRACAAGAGSLVIGIAPVGGGLAPAWISTLHEAAAAGLDIVSGMHTRLREVPGLAEAAARHGVRLHDVREPGRSFTVGSGVKREGRRLLTVGTDCALGKKYTALAIARALQARGVAADFRATGQTGILIAGSGVPLDAVVADFISGAAEALSPAAAPDHWDVIEGQGALCHPSYAGVTLGLVHGSQPDALVLCHDPLLTHLKDAPHVPIAPLPQVLDAYLAAARLTNPKALAVGVALNTSALGEPEALRACRAAEALTGLPATDPIRFGVQTLVDHLLAQQ
jgi:uncharacterized NAD-dependent epimerase/dehydratase family protein